MVTHRQHGDITGVEPEQPLEFFRDLRLQRTARGETRELGRERVDGTIDGLTGGFDPVGTGPQRVGHGGRQARVGGVAHAVFDGLEEVREELQEERRVQRCGRQSARKISRHPGANRVGAGNEFDIELTEVDLAADVSCQRELGAREATEIAFGRVDRSTRDLQHGAFDDRSARPSGEDLTGFGHLDAGISKRHHVVVARNRSTVGELQLERETGTEVVSTTEFEGVAVGPDERALDVVVIGARAHDTGVA